MACICESVGECCSPAKERERERVAQSLQEEHANDWWLQKVV